MTYKNRPDLEINVENEFESLFIDITINNEKGVVGEIYRVPNTSEPLSVSRYETIMRKLHSTKARVLLGTDQNFDYFKIQTHRNTYELYSHFLTSGLIPSITIPSRITHSSATLIDNIYIDINHIIRHVHSGTLIYDISDHLPIFMFYGKMNKQKHKSMVFHSRSLDNTKLKHNIRDHLEQTDFNFLRDLTVDNAHETCINLLTEITDLHAPIKTIVVHPKKNNYQPMDDTGIAAIIKYTKQTLQQQNWTNQPHTHHITNM